MPTDQQLVVLLTTGKSDNGKHATLAFSCALSATALGVRTTVFLTGDGAVWGYRGSASGISVQGFPPLSQLIEDFVESGGELLLCSVCHRTCGAGGPEQTPTVERLAGTEIAGLATVVERALAGASVTF